MTAFKKPLCGIIAFILVFVFVAAAPVMAFAEDEEVTLSAQEIELNKKTNDDGFEYIKVDEGSAIEIVGYKGSEKEVKVPKKINNLTVITIGAGAFEGNETVEVVDLHGEITVIRENAFKGCTSLVEVDSIDALETIGDSAFEGCTSLKSFTIPDSVVFVPARCFADCTSLEEVDVHKNLKGVEKDAFTGSAWENAKEDGPLALGRIMYSHKGAVKDVVIPEGVSIIEDYAFLECKDIETLELGYDVEEIGEYAFQNCVNLKSVKVNDAMGIVAAGAFKGCTALQSIDFSESTLATIGYESFRDCTSLTEIKLAETISELGDYALANTKIKTIDFGKNVNSIGVSTFLNVATLESINAVDNNKTYTTVDGVLYNDNCKELIAFPAAKTGKFQLPQDVEKICEKAFYGSAISEVEIAEDAALYEIGLSAFENSMLTRFVVPQNVTKISNATFKNAIKLSDITVGENVEYIGAGAFEGCLALKEISLPASVYTIANSAFKNAGLKKADLGDGVAKISADAFSGNKNLSDVVLGKNVEKIGVNAFANCVALKSIELSKSLKDISGLAFSGCAGLKKITVNKDSKNYKAVDNVVYTADGKALVLVNGVATSVNVADGTEVILTDSFANANNVSAITFPATLKNVENKALDNTAWFAAQSGIVYTGPVLYSVIGDVATVNVAAGTVSIADGAVNNEAVEVVTLPDTLTYIGKCAFMEAAIKEIAIPESVDHICVGAFKDCKSLGKITLPSKLEEIEASVFKGCAALSEIMIPEAVKVISTDAFAGCKKLNKVGLSKVEEIEEYAFAGCKALGSIELPKTIVTVSPLAFYECEALQGIAISGDNKTYKSLDGILLIANEEGVFDTIAIYPAGKKGEYKVPKDIINIGEKAFYNCDALTSVVFEPGFMNIGAEAFYDCDSIKSVNIPDSDGEIGEYAFASCDSLVEFIVNSNLTKYAENTFDGCYYFGYDSVTINVPDNSGMVLAVIVGVFVVIGIVWYLVYNKKQKKIQKEIIEKNKLKELEAANKD